MYSLVINSGYNIHSSLDNMKMKLYFSVLVFLCPILITHLYAFVHDQIAYTFSPEFFTKHQFYQYGISTSYYEWAPSNPRFYVMKASIIGSWWIGLIFSIVYLNLISFRRNHINRKEHFVAIAKTMLVHFFVTAVTSCVGFLYGLTISKNNIHNLLVENPQLQNIQNIPRFFAVYYADLFSYIGGGIGLIVGLFVKKLYLNRQLQLVRRDLGD